MSYVILVMAATAAGLPAAGEAKLPSSPDLTAIRALTVQHDGRWPPLDTAARDIVESVTGEVFHGGKDPVLLLLAWTFNPQTWMREPLIRIRNAELRRELQLSATQTVFSYAELAGHARLASLIDELATKEGDRKLNPLESKVSDIHEKLLLLQRVFAGKAIRPVPNAEDPVGAWSHIAAPVASASEELKGVQGAWLALKKAFLADDGAAFAAASQQLVAALSSLPTVRRPNPQLISTELRYNRLSAFTTAWKIMVVGAVLAAAAMLVRRKWFDVVALAGMIAGFAVLTYGLSLRWQIAGRIPATNMFESLLFLSWGMGAFAILSVLLMRDRLVPLTASGMGALTLFLADSLPLDHFVRPAVPVLMDTVWMSIHVPIIMVSYSVLALGVLVAHVQLVVLAAVPLRHKLIRSIDLLHYWYIHVGTILLFVGVVTGSMWAASSWGRYWGWDPKEVWSLIALLGYLTVLHVRIDHQKVPPWAYALGALLAVGLLVLVVPLLGPLTASKTAMLLAAVAVMVLLVAARGELATALKSILCFWLIIMTYVGVNYVLGMGLHSYGFGTGAVVRYMFLTGGLDLAFIGLCCLVYLARRSFSASLPAAYGLPT